MTNRQRNILILAGIVIVIAIFFPIIKRNYDDITDQFQQEKLYRSFGDSVLVFPFVSYKSTGVIQFRLNHDKHNVSYNCMVSADSGYILSDSSNGAITIELNDKSAFLLDKVVLTKKTSIADVSDNVCSFIYRGECDVPVKLFVKVKSVTVFNTLTFLRKANPADLADRKQKKHATEIKPRVTEVSNEEMVIWKKKAERIRLGMSYREMIDNAGEPRYTERITSSERIVDGYDEVKYNYGIKWVYLRNKLVAMIR